MSSDPEYEKVMQRMATSYAYNHDHFLEVKLFMDDFWRMFCEKHQLPGVTKKDFLDIFDESGFLEEPNVISFEKSIHYLGCDDLNIKVTAELKSAILNCLKQSCLLRDSPRFLYRERPCDYCDKNCRGEGNCAHCQEYCKLDCEFADDECCGTDWHLDEYCDQCSRYREHCEEYYRQADMNEIDEAFKDEEEK
jgi:hypothetical protein